MTPQQMTPQQLQHLQRLEQQRKMKRPRLVDEEKDPSGGIHE
jgi:hypothetical protein